MSTGLVDLADCFVFLLAVITSNVAYVTQNKIFEYAVMTNVNKRQITIRYLGLYENIVITAFPFLLFTFITVE